MCNPSGKPIKSFAWCSKHAMVATCGVERHIDWWSPAIPQPVVTLYGHAAATEQLALHTNETIGGLLNATFGNATELIICYFLLQSGQLATVPSSRLTRRPPSPAAAPHRPPCPSHGPGRPA